MTELSLFESAASHLVSLLVANAPLIIPLKRWQASSPNSQQKRSWKHTGHHQGLHPDSLQMSPSKQLYREDGQMLEKWLLVLMPLKNDPKRSIFTSWMSLSDLVVGSVCSPTIRYDRRLTCISKTLRDDRCQWFGKQSLPSLSLQTSSVTDYGPCPI